MLKVYTIQEGLERIDMNRRKKRNIMMKKTEESEPEYEVEPQEISKLKGGDIKSISEIKKIEAGDDFYETGKIMGSNELSPEMKEKTDFTKSLNDFDVEYHDPPEKIARDSGISLATKTFWVFDPVKKKKIKIVHPSIQQGYTYYEPGTYTYGSANYTPSYEESVLLSSTNGFF